MSNHGLLLLLVLLSLASLSSSFPNRKFEDECGTDRDCGDGMHCYRPRCRAAFCVRWVRLRGKKGDNNCTLLSHDKQSLERSLAHVCAFDTLRDLIAYTI